MAGLGREIGNFNGVATNQRATRDIPKGTVFNQIDLEIKENGSLMTVANMRTKVEEVVVKFDGNIIWRFTGNQLIMLNAVYGVPDDDGYLSLHFGKPYMQTIAGQDAFAVGTRGLNSFQIEVKFGTVTGPELVARALVTSGADRNGQPLGVGEHVTYKQYNLDVSSTGEIEVSTIPTGPNRALVAVHFFTDDIDQMELHVNHNLVMEGPVTWWNSVYKKFGYVKQAGMISLYPGYDRRASSVQNLNAEDVRIRLGMTGTGNIPYIVEMVEQRP